MAQFLERLYYILIIQFKYSIAIFFLFVFIEPDAQENRKFKIHTIAFYNVENLFDTIDDPHKFDESSPIMEINFNREEIYKRKIQNMAKVISEIGKDQTNTSPVIIGLAEVENRDVLEDLANNEALYSQNYGIVHYDSPDARGIDVALLYKKQLFIPQHTSSHELKIFDDTSRKRVYTRDQLLVSGKLEDELIHVIVNHWPSRRGGEARSRPKRVAAAKLTKRLTDSLQADNPYAKIFIMGDLNDDPTNDSVKKILNAKRNKDDVGLKGLYNPMENMAKMGLGTIPYRDVWNLFDQILITQPLLDDDYSTFRFFKAGIFNQNYLINNEGRWKGYPQRSFANGSFTGGYSDHFPVYVNIIKEVN